MIYTRISPAIMLIILSLSCGDTGVIPREDPTDQDAIYNIIRFDRPSAFNIDLLDFSIPDTLMMNASNVVVESFWYDLDSATYFIGIDIHELQPGDSLGAVPEANVSVSKNFFGSFEIIGTDTTGGGSVPVRLSEEFKILGLINAKFEKFGFNRDDRRGWILTEISDVVYASTGSGQIFGQIHISSISYPDHPVNSAMKNMAETLTFAPGESLTVTVTYAEQPDIVRLRYRSGNSLRTILLQPDDSGAYTAGFRMPNVLAYDHFLLNSIRIYSEGDSVDVISNAAGVLYRTR